MSLTNMPWVLDHTGKRGCALHLSSTLTSQVSCHQRLRERGQVSCPWWHGPATDVLWSLGAESTFLRWLTSNNHSPAPPPPQPPSQPSLRCFLLPWCLPPGFSLEGFLSTLESVTLILQSRPSSYGWGLRRKRRREWFRHSFLGNFKNLQIVFNIQNIRFVSEEYWRTGGLMLPIMDFFVAELCLEKCVI